MTPLAAPPQRARLAAAAAARPQLLALVLETLEEGKAENVVTIDLAGKTTIADQMVIASGRSARQIQALTEHLEAALARRVRPAIEGKAQGEWVLIDAGDVIVHLFRPETRATYNLEKLWSGERPGEAPEAMPEAMPAPPSAAEAAGR